MSALAATARQLVEPLSDDHRSELEQSAIAPRVAEERGYRTVQYAERAAVADLGMRLERDAFPGLLLPMYRVTGEPNGLQFKPAVPVRLRDRLVKYVSPRGQTNRLDVHPRNSATIKDVGVPLWITEGIKKGDSLTSRGCCTVTLTGVYNWRNKHGALGDWEDVPLKGREAIVCFDADARQNANVALAMVRIGRWLRSKGASTIRYVIVPADAQGRSVKGVDDYFAAGGTLETLLAAATTREPEIPTTADDAFTDARLAEVLADEVLADRFIWCRAIGSGWLRWADDRWTETTDETVVEAARQFVLDRFRREADAVRSVSNPTVKGWLSMLSVGRQRAVLGLAKGIVEHQADEFDADPELLNTPTGVVNLRSGETLPHDPDLLMTKCTHGSYRPGYTHPDWRQALSALPESVEPWFQVRIGQAITGNPTPDGLIPIMQGGGENGKSAIGTDGLLPALGDYAEPVSPKLISDRSEHSTERADLRGQRLLIAEELTEDRALNITTIKQISDVGTIKARKIRRDNVTFRASHSLFLTSNYVPHVAETDHGTWRRLALITFPIRYRKAGEPLIGALDRLGDPGLKARIRSGSDGQHDAIVTWAVEGAIGFYQNSERFPELPREVEEATRAWRRQADRVLGFWDECLIATPDACIAKTDLLLAFNRWLETNGHHAWSSERFHQAFKAHSETSAQRVDERQTTQLRGLSRPPSGSTEEIPAKARVYLGVRFRAFGETIENAEENRESSGEVPNVPNLLRFRSKSSPREGNQNGLGSSGNQDEPIAVNGGNHGDF